jgi:hypothetical protein
MINLEQTIMEKIHRFPPEKLQKMLEYAESLEKGTESSKSKKQTIWDQIEDIVREVPEEAWSELPIDGSLNVDHYLYGAPKRTK